MIQGHRTYLDSSGAMLSARAGRQSRSHVSLSAPDGRPSLSRVVPMFTSRTLRPPHAKGHRKWLEVR
jgi:hypothetical protein